MKPKAIAFYGYLPPWKIDVFNEMGKFYELTLFFFISDAEGFIYNRELLLKKLNVKAVFLNNGFRIGSKAFRFGIKNIINSYNPEIVFSHEYTPISIQLATLLHLKLCNFKLIITTSDNLEIVDNASLLKETFRKYILKSAKGIIVYSKNVKNWYNINYPYLKVDICPNIQKPLSLLKNKNEFPKIFKSYKDIYHLNKPYILYVGRLEKVKGLDLLIKAFSLTLKDSHILVLVGEGGQKEKLKNIAKEYNVNESVIFPGHFDDVNLYTWYAMAHFFVIPSLYEPFGAVVNEALVFGCPVLASKNIGAIDYINVGINGFIFDPENENEFINGLNNCNNYFHDAILYRKNLMTFKFEDYVKSYNDIYFI